MNAHEMARAEQRRRSLRPDWQRWVRPDAERWLRPDVHRFMPPGAPRYVGKDVVRYFWPHHPLERAAQRPNDENCTGAAHANFDIDQNIAASQRLLLRLKAELAEITAELKFRRFLRDLAAGRYLARKAGFNPDQPRVPAGNPEGGQWTSEGGVQVTTSPGFITGNAAIDNISQALSDTLLNVIEVFGSASDMTPQQYGIAVHTAFAYAVRLQNLPGVGYAGVEETFSLEDSDPTYGLAGSIRTDVTLRDNDGRIIAIYDIKTGDRILSSARADELRIMSRAAPDTPVFELHIVRGLNIKTLSHLLSGVGPIRRSSGSF